MLFRSVKKSGKSPRRRRIYVYGPSPMLAFALAPKGYFSPCTAWFSPLLEKRLSQIPVLSGMPKTHNLRCANMRFNLI